MQKSYLGGYSLVEIMVVIAIIGIIAYGASQFNFNQLSQRQQIDIDSTKFASNFEEVRNNALVWKAVLNGWDLEAARAWKIRLTTAGVFSSHYSLDGTFWDQVAYDSLTWAPRNPFSILSMECRRINGGSPVNVSSWAEIQFHGSDLELRCDSSTYDSRDKILVIEYGVPSLFRTVTINTLTGVIEID